jgi:hypothetical protein
MSTRRRLACIGILTTIAVAGTVVFVLGRPSHPICERSFRQIRPGMSQETVEQLLGGPPGDYRTEIPFENIEFVNRDGEERVWKSDYGSIYVWFDESSIVLSAEFIDPLAPPDTVVRRVLEWFWPRRKEVA